MNIMLDLETLGNGQNAAIVAIGAVCFDFDTEQLGAQFYQTIDLESSVAGGGIMAASTVLWWLQQSEAARQEIIGGIMSIDSALKQFSDWIGSNQDNVTLKMWGNGAAFDNVILASAYRRHNLLQPWDYRNDRCYRTIQGLNPGRPMPKTGTPHNALVDAINQARHLIDLINYEPSIIIY